MIGGFIVTLNNQTIYEYKKSGIPGRLMRYLDQMDNDMLKGIQLGDQWQTSPTDFQKQQYIAMTLFRALQHNDKNLVNIMSAYLSDRYESISEIHTMQNDDLFTLRIISI